MDQRHSLNSPSETAPSVFSYTDGDSMGVSAQQMLSRDHRVVQETRLVIGLDYGTTYTGVAYATPSGAQCSLGEIDVMVEWGTTVDDKVPSVISYSRSSQEWGNTLSAKAITMVHTKLELGVQKMLEEMDMTLQMLDGMSDLNFPDMMMNQGSHDAPTYSHKSPEEIVTDYLTKVFQYLEKEVTQFGSTARKHTTTDLVVTVPTEWSYMAMNSTYRALTKAGFNCGTFPKLRDVMFVTEPEAAALYTARYFRDDLSEEFLKQGQYFMLCDAGGGTVDIVSYHVKALHPLLQLEQIGEPTGSKCGSIFINLEFKKWLRGVLTDEDYRELDPRLDVDRVATHASETPSMRALMKEFDSKKREFRRVGGDCLIELPEPIQNLTIPGIVNQGLLTIKRKEMESFFDASIRKIVRMIKGQINGIRVKYQNRPRHLLMVGGYGESDYLQYQIAEMLKHENFPMELRTPSKSWTAVVRGAVICGIEKSEKSLRCATACRNSYAICLDEFYSAISHTHKDAVKIGGSTFAQSQLIWLLNKGDLILVDEPCKVEQSFDLRLMRPRQDTLPLPIWKNLSEEEHRPTRRTDATNELERVGQLNIDFSKIQFEHARTGTFSKSTELQTTLKLVLEAEPNALWASLWWKGTKLEQTPVEYK